MVQFEDALKKSFSLSSKARTGFFVDEAFVRHDRLGHPESGSRISSVVDEISNTPSALSLRPLAFSFPDFQSESSWVQNLSPAHDRRYLESIFRKLERQEYVSPSRWSAYGGPYAREAVFKAAIGTSELASAVAAGEIDNGFAVVRPPGHHAGFASAEGYCCVNNVALAARNVVQRFGRKVLILDLDVHHGNGTEEIVFEDPEISYLSIHQDDWPFTGSFLRTGKGTGSGGSFNLPLPVAADGRSWLKAFDKFVIPIVENLKPYMILVSMGYDTHWRDPQGSMLLSSGDQLELTAKVRSLAKNFCEGRLVFVLEGGYDRRATASGVLNSLADLAGSEAKLIFDAYGVAPQLSSEENRRVSLKVDESIAKSLAAYGF